MSRHFKLKYVVNSKDSDISVPSTATQQPLVKSPVHPTRVNPPRAAKHGPGYWGNIDYDAHIKLMLGNEDEYQLLFGNEVGTHWSSIYYDEYYDGY